MPTLAWKRNRAYAVHYSTIKIQVGDEIKKKRKARWIPLGIFQTKKDGKSEYMRYLLRNRALGSKIILFEDYIPNYLEWARSQKAETTIDREENTLKHLKAEFGHLRLEAIKAEVLLAYKNKYSYCKKTTMRNRLGLLKQMLSLAHKWGYKTCQDPDPFSIVKVPRPQLYEFEDKSVDPDAMAAIIQSLSPKSHQVLAMVLNYTGIRLIEAWRIDPDRHINRKTWEFILTPDVTKTSRSRIIPISPKIRACLNVFPITFTRGAFTQSLKRACKKTGYPVSLVTPGVFRHQFGHMVVNTGDRNIRAAQKLLGHTSIALTARYAHPDKESLQRAVEGL